jgi:hypothetical protein
VTTTYTFAHQCLWHANILAKRLSSQEEKKKKKVIPEFTAEEAL